MKIPEKLTITDGAMAMDGGSIVLRGKDSNGNDVHIELDWSLDAQVNGTTKLSLNNTPLEKRSCEEEKFLEVLGNAVIQRSEGQDSSDSASFQGAALGEDINQYLNAMAEGPTAALKNLIERLISTVMSERYYESGSNEKQVKKAKEFHGPCDICGEPGYVQAHPNEPVSVIRCEEHSGTRTFNPISILVNLIVLLFIGGTLYLVFVIVKKLIW